MLNKTKFKKLKKELKRYKASERSHVALEDEIMTRNTQLRNENKIWRKAAVLGVVLYVGNWLFDPHRG